MHKHDAITLLCLSLYMPIGSQIEVRNLTLNSILVNEVDIVYFRSYLESTGQRDAELVTQWQLIAGSLLKLEELKAKNVGTKSTSNLVSNPFAIRSGRSTIRNNGSNNSRSTFSPFKSNNDMKKNIPNCTLNMSLEDASWSLGCLLSAAKQVIHYFEFFLWLLLACLYITC